MAEVKEILDEINKNNKLAQDLNDKFEAQVKAHGEASAEIKSQVAKVDEDLTKLLEAKSAAEARMDSIEAAIKRGGNAEEAKSDPARAEYADTFNKYLQGAATGSEVKSAYDKLEKKYMSVGSDANGGYWVPEEWIGMSEKIWDTSVMRQVANIVSTSRNESKIMTSFDEGACGWVSETGTRSKTDTPEIGIITIPNYELYARPEITLQLIDDGLLDMEAYLKNNVAMAIGRTAEAAYVNGTGTAQPEGWTVNTDVSSVGVSGVALTADKLFDVECSLNRAYVNGGQGKFLFSRLGYCAVRKLKDQNDNYLLVPGVNGAASGKLFEYDVMICDDLDDSAGGVIGGFGNWKKGYTISDRKGLSIQADTITNPGFVNFYMRLRTGGKVSNPYAIVKILGA